jgi:hypothetical protein
MATEPGMIMAGPALLAANGATVAKLAINNWVVDGFSPLKVTSVIPYILLLGMHSDSLTFDQNASNN